MTIGEDRVRIKFNPSANGIVATIKHRSAELINLCEHLKAHDARLASLAQTAYEEAAMWAVKAVTAAVKDAPTRHAAGAPHISTKSTELDSY